MEIFGAVIGSAILWFIHVFVRRVVEDKKKLEYHNGWMKGQEVHKEHEYDWATAISLIESAYWPEHQTSAYARGAVDYARGLRERWADRPRREEEEVLEEVAAPEEVQPKQVRRLKLRRKP